MGKKVYILGAGAAFLYNAPSTQDITLSVSWLNGITRNLDKYLTDYFGSNYYNFETLLAALEFIITENKQAGKDTFHYAIPPALSRLKCRFKKADAEGAYLECINYIIECIYSYERNRDHTKDVVVAQHFAKATSNHIYSLNYDRIIPSIWKTHGTIFSDGTINGGSFDYPIVEFKNAPKTFFNIHGNIYLRDSTNSLSFNNVFQGEKPSFIKKLSPLIGGNPREWSFFTPIISGYSKSQHLLSKPFSFGIATLAIDLQECDELEIIGYSFNDNHINSLLGSFFDFKNKPLIIVEKMSRGPSSAQLEDLQQELSSFYCSLPEGPSFKDGMYYYRDHPLRIFADGVENYINRF